MTEDDADTIKMADDGYQDLFQQLDEEHEHKDGETVVCKKHLALSLRAINDDIDENQQESFAYLL